MNAAISDHVESEIGRILVTHAKFDRMQLASVWQNLTGMTVGQNRDAFSAVEDSFLAAMQLDTAAAGILHFSPGGWTVRLEQGMIQAALVAAVLTGLLVLTNCQDIPSALWPTVLPILLAIEKCKLSRSEGEILAVLSLSDRVKNQQIPVEDLYLELPAEIRESFNYLDFLDVVDSLHRAGHADVDGRTVLVRTDGTKQFRITIE